MKNIIPYEHDIKFDTKIYEILSISLEHEDKILDDSIVGNFIVNGEYKTHNISINKEEFEYKIPFEIELSDNIIKDSISYDISDFTYDIKGDDTLTLKIELELNYEELDERFDKILDDIEINNENEIKKEINNDEVSNDNDTNVIFNNTLNNNNTYVNYHVYNVLEDDDIINIASKFNSSKELIMEYNNLEELNKGMKIIVPEVLDE